MAKSGLESDRALQEVEEIKIKEASIIVNDIAEAQNEVEEVKKEEARLLKNKKEAVEIVGSLKRDVEEWQTFEKYKDQSLEQNKARVAIFQKNVEILVLKDLQASESPGSEAVKLAEAKELLRLAEGNLTFFLESIERSKKKGVKTFYLLKLAETKLADIVETIEIFKKDGVKAAEASKIVEAAKVANDPKIAEALKVANDPEMVKALRVVEAQNRLEVVKTEEVQLIKNQKESAEIVVNLRNDVKEWKEIMERAESDQKEFEEFLVKTRKDVELIAINYPQASKGMGFKALKRVEEVFSDLVERAKILRENSLTSDYLLKLAEEDLAGIVKNAEILKKDSAIAAENLKEAETQLTSVIELANKQKYDKAMQLARDLFNNLDPQVESEVMKSRQNISDRGVNSSAEIQSPATISSPGIKDLISGIKKEVTYQGALQTFQRQCNKPNSAMKPFSVLSKNVDDGYGNKITTYIMPGLSLEESKNPENHVKYKVSSDGKLSIDVGKKTSCILPPQAKEDGKGFDMLKIENGRPSSLVNLGTAKSADNISIGGVKVKDNEILPNLSRANSCIDDATRASLEALSHVKEVMGSGQIIPSSSPKVKVANGLAKI